MKKILVPVDGSEHADRAVAHAIRLAADYKGAAEVHLLTVCVPVVSGNVKMFVGQDAIDAYYRSEGEKALASARKLLDDAKQPYVFHIGVGQAAEIIVEYTGSKQCDQIVMGSRGLGSVSGLLLGSVATKVIHLSPVPVTLVK